MWPRRPPGACSPFRHGSSLPVEFGLRNRSDCRRSHWRLSAGPVVDSWVISWAFAHLNVIERHRVIDRVADLSEVPIRFGTVARIAFFPLVTLPDSSFEVASELHLEVVHILAWDEVVVALRVVFP